MKRLNLFVLIFIALGFTTLGQIKKANVSKRVPFTLRTGIEHNHRTCHTTHLEEKLLNKYPNRLTIPAFEKVLSEQIRTKENARVNEQLYRIPTIIHVIHNGESIGTGANISEAQVLSQFEVLNDDFRKRGAGANDDPVGADILIEFYPVAFDEEGNALEEAGINRVNGMEPFWGEQAIEEELKPSTIWDPDRFFNIWVLEFGGDLEGVLGYAQFPSMSGLEGLFEDEGESETDGIVVGYQYFGTTGNVEAPFDGGRTTTHEVGHWLGLRHIWGDGGCEVDDYCLDTPPAGEPNYGCPDSDTCADDDEQDMVENYMDYTNDACMNIFTQDQKDRIRAVLEVSPRRNSLTLPPCEGAEEIIVGTFEVSPPAWYKYTAEADEVVTINSIGLTEENTFLALYADCTSGPITSEGNSFGTSQSAYQQYLAENESIYFLWNNLNGEEAFEFEISRSEPEEGLACDLAIDAVEGDNEIPTTAEGIVWYTFTMPDELSKVVVEVSDTVTVYRGDCEQLQSVTRTSGTFSIFDFNKDELILLAVESTENSTSFGLEVKELVDGEACVTAVGIEVGDYTSPEQVYWYKLTAEDYGEFVFKSELAGTLSIFEDCGSQPVISESLDSNDPFSTTVALGDELKIKWDFEESTLARAWNVGFEPFPEGAVCQTAILVEEDTIDSQGPPIWYRYELPQDGTVTISSVGLTEEDTYLAVYDDCAGSPLIENDDFGGGFQSQISIPSLQQGDVLQILWLDVYSTADFEWTVNVREDIPGEFCETAVEASLEENTAVANGTGLSWFTFTPEVADKKIVIESDVEQFAGFLSGDCQQGFDLISSGTGNAVLIDYEVGETLYIRWENDGENDFSWTLSYEDIGEGDVCSLAFEAMEGSNQSPYAPAWFTYTMSADGNLSVSSVGLTDEDTYLLIFDDCDGDLLGLSDDAEELQSEVIIQDLMQGDQVFIFWDPIYSSNAFEWELEEFTPPPGSTCSTANVLLRPEVVTDVTPPVWFSYAMPKAGDLKISSVGLTQEDTYVYVQDGCGPAAAVLGSSDDVGDGLQSELTITDLDSGSVVKIQWLDIYSSEAFSFELALENVKNATPEVSNQTFELDTKMTDGDTIGFVMANDEDLDRLLYTTTSDMMGMVSIDSVSGVLRLTDRESLMAYRQDLVLDVEVTDGIAVATAQVTLLNNLLSLEEQITVSLYPNPASSKVKIEATGFEIQQAYILDISSRRIESPTVRSGELSISHLNPGVYFVQVEVNGVTKTLKLIVD